MYPQTKSSAVAIDPEVAVFSSTQEKLMSKRVQDIHDHTVTYQIEDPTDLRLDETGCTKRGGYRFTVLALSQLCHYLCPGLSKTIFGLSTYQKKQDYDRKHYSVPLSTKLLNDLIDLRFDFLGNKFLITNTKTKVIEGVTSSAYLHLSNLSFLEHIQSIIPDCKYPCIFDSASIAGRRFILNYHRQPLLYQTESESYYAGYTFINSETGDSSVRQLPTLVMFDNDKNRYDCFRATPRGRIVHTGSKFNKRISKQLTGLISETLVGRDLLNDRDIPSCLINLQNKSLGFGKLSEPQHHAKLKELIHKLMADGIKYRPIAKRISYLTIYKARSDIVNTSRANLGLNDWHKRTTYDLFINLLKESNNLTFSIKAGLQLAAFRLLTGKLQLDNDN